MWRRLKWEWLRPIGFRPTGYSSGQVVSEIEKSKLTEPLKSLLQSYKAKA
jgi:hypothetical protein